MLPSEKATLTDWLRFHLAFLYKPQWIEQLIQKYGAPERFLRAPYREIEDDFPRIPPSVRAAMKGRKTFLAAKMERDRAEREGISILRRECPEWPINLRGLEGMPLVLFSRGRILPRDGAAVGIVGSRRPSRHGLRQAERFAGALASLGVTVVSGLARGIDAAAHRGALEAGGRTIAVLGSGLGRLYPREHLALARRISGSGAVISEFPWDTPPRQFHFPHRNRILSALSLGILVVEAGEKSGSLITANWALDQNREVFALPGRIDCPEARGALRLIQDGARLVIDPGEIAEILGIRARPVGGEKHPPGSDKGRSLPAHLELLFREEDSWHADQLIERLGRAPGEVLAELSRLEAQGLLLRLPGGAYGRAIY